MDLPQRILKSIQNLAQEHGIQEVILFGSRARGDNRERSDIDLAIQGGDTLHFTLDMEDKVPTLLFFDVVNLDEAVQPELLESIQKEGKALYEKI